MADWKIDLRSSLSDFHTGDGVDLVETYMWGIEAWAQVVCLALIIFASFQISDEKYVKGLVTFIGGALAGVSPYLAKQFFL